MSRIFSVCLCAIVTFVSVAGAMLLEPAAVSAANGTLTMATPLQDAPDPSASMIVLLAPGAVVTIEGPPIDAFYPVSAEGYSGWMRGETMSLAKDVPPDEDSATPQTEDGSVPADGEVPFEQDASEDPLTAQELAPPAEEAVPAADSSSQPVSNDGYTSAEPVVSDNAGGADGVTQAPDAVVNATAPAETTAPVQDPAAAAADPNAVPPVSTATPADSTGVPVDPSAGTIDASPPATDPAAEPVVVQTDDPAATDQAIVAHPEPVLVSATVTEPPVQSGEAAPTSDPALAPVAATETPTEPPADVTTQTLADPAAVSPTPSAAPSPAPTETPAAGAELAPSPTPEPPLALNGPAYVVVDMPVRDGPGDQFGLVFTVPAGSSLLRTGSYEAGWISVQYKEVYGWARAEQMSEPIEVKEEEPLSDVVSTKEPKPG